MTLLKPGLCKFGWVWSSLRRRPQSFLYQRCGVGTEFPYRLFSLKEICSDHAVEAEFSVQVLGIRVASGVDSEFPYRVCIVDRGLIAATLFAATVSDSQM